MSEYGSAPPRQEVSGWAVGGLTFAGTVMLIVGFFHVITGLAAVIDDQFFVVDRHYAFDLNTNAWGVIEMLIGIAVAGTGWALLARREWAGIVAIVVASLSAIGNFFFIPYYPFWAILVIALD